MNIENNTHWGKMPVISLCNWEASGIWGNLISDIWN